MKLMDIIAMCIGYLLMSTGGIAIVLALIWIACEIAWRICTSMLNATCIFEAVAEWKKAHPEKYAKWKVRTDIANK